MSKKSEIDLDFLDEYIKLFSLSDDITKATEADKNHISKAIHIKLSYDTINCIDDCIEDFEKEIKNYPHVLAKKYGIEPKSKERMLEFLQQKPWLLSNITRASETLSDINEFKDEHNGHYSFLTPDETCEKILSWVTTINRLRASYDIVPLVTRAIYADKVRAAIDVWHKNKNSPNANKEDFWQIELKNNLEILERIIGHKVLLIGEQAHFGGEDIQGKGGKIPDFAFECVSTNNLVIVEIKKPTSKLLGAKYRNNVYGLSADLSGAIAQVLTQRNQIMNSFYEKKCKSNSNFEVHKPRCFIITGDASTELKGNSDKSRSFELLRSTVEPDVTIKTFDELYDNFIAFNETNEI